MLVLRSTRVLPVPFPKMSDIVCRAGPRFAVKDGMGSRATKTMKANEDLPVFRSRLEGVGTKRLPMLSVPAKAWATLSSRATSLLQPWIFSGFEDLVSWRGAQPMPHTALSIGV